MLFCDINKRLYYYRVGWDSQPWYILSSEVAWGSALLFLPCLSLISICSWGFVICLLLVFPPAICISAYPQDTSHQSAPPRGCLLLAVFRSPELRLFYAKKPASLGGIVFGLFWAYSNVHVTTSSFWSLIYFSLNGFISGSFHIFNHTENWCISLHIYLSILCNKDFN